MNRRIINLFKSTILIAVILLFTSCSKNDSDPCANSTLAVTATAEEYTIKATATGGVEPYEYSIDGTTFQTSDTFTDVESGDYTLTVRDANTCTSTTSVAEADLNSLLDERDGQRYKIVKIGNQIWLGENFNFDTNTTATTSSWCYDDDEATNCDTYGRLYTWEAASQLAPEGWKLPTQGDWQVLFNEVGGNMAHIKLIGGDFEALLAGFRRDDESFGNLGSRAYFWSSTPGTETNVYYMYAMNTTDYAQGSANNNTALSVRLIKIQNN